MKISMKITKILVNIYAKNKQQSNMASFVIQDQMSRFNETFLIIFEATKCIEQKH